MGRMKKEDIRNLQKKIMNKTNNINKHNEQMYKFITNRNEELLRSKEEVRSSWSEYFHEFLNGKDESEGKMSCLLNAD